MAIHDEVTRITGARAEGEAEGIIKGKLETARKMFDKHLAEDMIAEITGLSLEQIRKLREEINGEKH